MLRTDGRGRESGWGNVRRAVESQNSAYGWHTAALAGDGFTRHIRLYQLTTSQSTKPDCLWMLASPDRFAR